MFRSMPMCQTLEACLCCTTSPDATTDCLQRRGPPGPVYRCRMKGNFDERHLAIILTSMRLVMSAVKFEEAFSAENRADTFWGDDAALWNIDATNFSSRVCPVPVDTLHSFPPTSRTWPHMHWSHIGGISLHWPMRQFRHTVICNNKSPGTFATYRLQWLIQPTNHAPRLCGDPGRPRHWPMKPGI